MKKLLPLLCLIFAISSCSTLRDLTDVQKPTVSYSNVSVQSVSFDGVTLLFDFDVNNPNRMDVTADRYTYEFFINDNLFLEGEQSEQVTIKQQASSVVQVPVAFNFSELAESFRSVLRQDDLSYRLATEVMFDMPVMGSQRVPVEASGTFPIPKIPRITFGDLNVKSMSLTGADVEAQFDVSNPNDFAIQLSDAAYQLEVNGREWLDTRLQEDLEVLGAETRTITIPIRLSSSQMGSALLDMLSGNQNFDYRLTGTAEISAIIEGFPLSEQLPFDLSGTYQLD